MFSKFQKIVNKYKKRSQRGTDYKLIGVKSLECNFNPKDRTYNPHFHLIVPNEKTAEAIKAEWLACWPKKIANEIAQHSRPVKDLESDLVEIIKYRTKTFTELDASRKSGKKEKPTIYALAMDNIYKATKGIRIFDRFGFNTPKAEKKASTGGQWLVDYYQWEYDPKAADWLHPTWEMGLTDYNPPAELRNLLDNHINTDLE